MLFLKAMLMHSAHAAQTLLATIARSRLILFLIILALALIVPSIVADATQSLIVEEVIRWIVDRIERR